MNKEEELDSLVQALIHDLKAYAAIWGEPSDMSHTMENVIWNYCSSVIDSIAIEAERVYKEMS